jgi:hypothetical protein
LGAAGGPKEAALGAQDRGRDEKAEQQRAADLSELIACVADTESDSVVDAPVSVASRWVASAESNECASPRAGGSLPSPRVESS